MLGDLCGTLQHIINERHRAKSLRVTYFGSGACNASEAFGLTTSRGQRGGCLYFVLGWRWRERKIIVSCRITTSIKQL